MVSSGSSSSLQYKLANRAGFKKIQHKKRVAALLLGQCSYQIQGSAFPPRTDSRQHGLLCLVLELWRATGTKGHQSFLEPKDTQPFFLGEIFANLLFFFFFLL